MTKLNASGSHLLYSTYLGGSGDDGGGGIAVDAAGSAYVTGYYAIDELPDGQSGPGHERGRHQMRL